MAVGGGKIEWCVADGCIRTAVTTEQHWVMTTVRVLVNLPLCGRHRTDR